MTCRKRRTFLFIIALFLLCPAIPAAAQQAAPPATPADSKFIILLSNDDGYDAPGLRALTEALRTLGEVYVSAPATDQSGKGHSIITAREPIFVNEKKQQNGLTWYAVEAPPATCVRLAIEALLPRRPDIVISGINRGDNLGVSSQYLSGTVGAAREAAIGGIPAMAVSMEGNNEKDYAATAEYIRQLVGRLREKGLLKPGFFLNVNAPAGEVKGVRVTRLSLMKGKDAFERRTSPRGRLYFWSLYRPPEKGDEVEEGTDTWAYLHGFISLTPMLLDTTATKEMPALKQFETKAATK